jgi:hypothetical protein
MAAAGIARAAPLTDLNRHAFLLSGEWDHRKDSQTLYLVRGGKLVWSYSLDNTDAKGDGVELGDATLLSNGNVLFAHKTGASEVTPDKHIAWTIAAPAGAEIHTLQPVGRDRVMVMQNGNPARLMVIHKPTGSIEIDLNLPVPHPDKAHIQFRRVRMTEQGTFVAGHLDDKKVVEYDRTGRPIWTFIIDRPWGVERLKNGNTLISSYNANGMTEVVEVTPRKEIVWRFSQDDIPADRPDWRCFQFQGVKRLANGNTLVCNWCAGALKDITQWQGTVQVFEVTPAKTIAWTLSAWDNPDLGTGSSIQLLDQPGGLGVSA